MSILKSAQPDTVIPDVCVTDHVLRHVERLHDKIAMVEGVSGKAVTYGQLARGAVPDDEAGELPKAFIVPKEGSDVALDALQAFVAERVATYKQIRQIALVDAIPKSASGKILRRELRS